MAELNGLMELRCFEVVDEKEAGSSRIYCYSFADKVKGNGEKKSRFCVAAFNDKEHSLFTAALTVRRLSIRQMSSLCSSLGFAIFTMALNELRRPVYMCAPSELRVPAGQLLKVLKNLYGMPVSPIGWFETYCDYYKD